MSDRRQPILADGRRSRGFISVEAELFDLDLSGEALALLLRIRKDSDLREADGWIDSRGLRALAAYHNLTQCQMDALLGQLADAQTIRIEDGRVLDLNFLAWNRSAAERGAQRVAWTDRKRRSRGDSPPADGSHGDGEPRGESRRDTQRESRGESSGESHGESPPSHPESHRTRASRRPSQANEYVETDVSTPAAPAEPERADVDRLCQAMADSVEARGGKRPAVTAAWRQQARLLLDADGRTLGDALELVAWVAEDPFWRANVLSLPKLREKYDQLRLQRDRGPVRPPATAANGRSAPPPRHQLDADTRAAYAEASRSVL